MLDGLRSKLDSIIPSKPLEAVKAAVTSVETKAVETVKDGFDTAKSAASSAASTVESAKDTFEAKANAAGEAITSAGKTLARADVVDLGRSVLELDPRSREAVVEKATELYRRGEAIVDDVKKTVSDGYDSAVKTLDDGVESLKQATLGYAREVADAVDVDKNIDALKPGDKYKLGVGASASVEGIKGYEKGSIEVARTTDRAGDPCYTVTVDGELGGGVYAEAGGKLGPLKAGGDASATLGVGGKVELKFKTKEEAERAVKSLVTQSVVPPSADDVKFIADHVSAIELKGNVAADAAGALGVPLGKAQAEGLFGKASVKVEESVRIELPYKDSKGVDRPAQVLVRATGTGELAAGAGLRIGGESKPGKNPDNSGGTGIGIGAAGKATLELEQRFTLPPTLDTAKLLKDPNAELSRYSGEVQKTEVDKVTFTAEGQVAGLGSGRGAELTTSFQLSREDLIKSGAGAKFMAGDLEGGFKAIGDKTEVTVQSREFNTHGIAIEPAISIMGFGVGVSAEATRREYLNGPGSEPRHTNATRVFQELARLYEVSQPYKPLPYVRG